MRQTEQHKMVTDAALRDKSGLIDCDLFLPTTELAPKNGWRRRRQGKVKTFTIRVALHSEADRDITKLVEALLEQ